jgi:predicted HicB family RNase H-like nuclease
MKSKNEGKKQISEILNRFSYRAEWSEEDGVFIAFALELPSVKAHSTTPEGAVKEVKTPIKMALEMMLENGEKLPEPLSTQSYKGNLSVRTTPEKHKEIAIRAAEAHVSINQYILSKIG